MSTNVYLMKDGPTGWYKIGKSITPIKREKTLLAQQPCIDLLCYWADPDDTREAYLHQEFRSKRKRGEWFELTAGDVWRVYWLMRRHRRTDVHETAKAYAIEYRDKEWQFETRCAFQNRYIHVQFSPPLPFGRYARPTSVHTSMEWATDGQVEDIARNNARHPNDYACSACDGISQEILDLEAQIPEEQKRQII